MNRIALAFLLTACSTGPTDTTPKAEPAPAAAKDGHGHDHDDGHGHDHGDEKKPGMAETHKPTAGAKVMFASPAEGAKLKSPVKVTMGIEGMTIQPAGEIKQGTGHHHLIIDGNPVPFGTAVPADETHIHFGKGQTEAEVELKPGKHLLTLQLADGVHRSYGKEMSTSIHIEVE